MHTGNHFSTATANSHHIWRVGHVTPLGALGPHSRQSSVHPLRLDPQSEMKSHRESAGIYYIHDDEADLPTALCLETPDPQSPEWML